MICCEDVDVYIQYKHSQIRKIKYKSQMFQKMSAVIVSDIHEFPEFKMNSASILVRVQYEMPRKRYQLLHSWNCST